MNRTIQNCNVCVVGGAGFLGSHIVRHLAVDRQCQVTVVDNLVAGQLKFLEGIPSIRFRHHDITGAEDYLRCLFENKKIEYVFNYAAYPYIPDSFERPLHVFNVNAFGALKVINAAQDAGVKGILQISSAEIYGDAMGGLSCGSRNEKLDETAPIIPHSTYGASKAAIDAIVQVRWRESKTPVIALRQFNCVGENETHPYVIPEIISQLYHNPVGGLMPSPTIKLGNNSTRDFLYAGDQARMAVELLEEGQFGDVYNLGSELSTSIYDLAQTISGIVGCGRVVIEQDPKRVRPWEIWHLQSDNSKIYSVIESRPTVDLKEALKRTVAYYESSSRKWCWEN